MTATFGPTFSRILMSGCAALVPGGVPVEWVLAVLALESGFNPNAKNASGARGLFQKMPTNGVPYPCPAPEIQIVDAFAFWRSMVKAMGVTQFTSRGAFYCLNLAPARLQKNRGTPDRVLYSSRRDLHPLEYAPTAYQQNIGLDPKRMDGTRKGWIQISDLEPSLDRAVRNVQARYDAELTAAYVANVAQP